jgi:predicted ABC-type ATPase
VRHGGHNIPEATIRQRYRRSIRNFFELYRPMVTSWQVYDNSQPAYRQIARGDSGSSETILDPDTWDRFQKGGDDA